MTARKRSASVAVAALVATALWLRWGPTWLGARIGDAGGARGELAFTGSVYAPLMLIAPAGGALAGVTIIQWRADWAGAALRGGLLGLAGVVLATGYAKIAGTLVSGEGGGGGAVLLLGLGAVLFQVAAEEWLFRGLVQPLAMRVTGPAGGILLAALAFAGMHAVAGPVGALSLVNLLGGGLLFGLLAARDGGVAGAIAAHWAWNATEQLIVGLDPNPGVGGFGSLIDLDLSGAVPWGGSPDGLNASWAMAFALAALVVPLAMLARQSRL